MSPPIHWYVWLLKDDIQFISGNFLTQDLPNDKYYLYKYFTTDIEKQFVRYYLMFGNHKNFVDHTGCFCKWQWLNLLTKRLLKLEAVRKEAKKNFDLTLLAQIESGNYEDWL